MSSITISVQGVCKHFAIYNNPIDRLWQLILGRWKNFHQDYEALNEISFEVKSGQCVGIIGKNGAGKSTLLQILTGTLAPSTGIIKVWGRVAAILELGSGFNPELTGRQNVFLYGSLFNLKHNEILQRFDQIVDFAGIEEFIDLPVKTYSSGMQARLAFAVIAHVDADVLIIDEALAVGDAYFTQKCMSFLREFKQKGTILFVSHDISTVTAFCDTAIWLERGKIIAQGPAKDICEKYYAFMQTEMRGIKPPVLEQSKSRYLPLRSRQANSRIINSNEASKAKQNIVKEKQRIEMFGFNLDSKYHGSGDAKILNVQFLGLDGCELDLCQDSQTVIVRIYIEAINNIDRPIVGFIIKDKLGQPLIGGNTFHSYRENPVPAKAGQMWEVEFEFKLPILALGDYSVVAAIGNGSLDDHVHLHWLHDAVFFKVSETSIDGVIVGAQLDRISFTVFSIEEK